MFYRTPGLRSYFVIGRSFSVNKQNVGFNEKKLHEFLPKKKLFIIKVKLFKIEFSKLIFKTYCVIFIIKAESFNKIKAKKVRTNCLFTIRD